MDRIALNAKAANPSQENCNRMLAAALGTSIRLWSIADDGTSREIGQYFKMLCRNVELALLYYTLLKKSGCHHLKYF